MKTLNEISNELLNIFNNIEENDGEITEEQLEVLNIAEDELKEKLSNYRKIINQWDSDIEQCKKESKRLLNVCKTRENRITRLKDRMLYAVNAFGNSGKTNKFIELEDCRIFTRNSISVEIDDCRAMLLSDIFIDIMTELYNNDVLETEDDVDLYGILQSINSIAKAEHRPNEEFIPFTKEDLTHLKISYTFDTRLIDLLNFNKTILFALCDASGNFNASINISKTSLKNLIESGENITFAKLVNNQSLQIK